MPSWWSFITWNTLQGEESQPPTVGCSAPCSQQGSPHGPGRSTREGLVRPEDPGLCKPSGGPGPLGASFPGRESLGCISSLRPAHHRGEETPEAPRSSGSREAAGAYLVSVVSISVFIRFRGGHVARCVQGERSLGKPRHPWGILGPPPLVPGSSWQLLPCGHPNALTQPPQAVCPEPAILSPLV